STRRRSRPRGTLASPPTRRAWRRKTRRAPGSRWPRHERPGWKPSALISFARAMKSVSPTRTAPSSHVTKSSPRTRPLWRASARLASASAARSRPSSSARGMASRRPPGWPRPLRSARARRATTCNALTGTSRSCADRRRRSARPWRGQKTSWRRARLPARCPPCRVGFRGCTNASHRRRSARPSAVRSPSRLGCPARSARGRSRKAAAASRGLLVLPGLARLVEPRVRAERDAIAQLRAMTVRLREELAASERAGREVGEERSRAETRHADAEARLGVAQRARGEAERAADALASSEADVRDLVRAGEASASAVERERAELLGRREKLSAERDAAAGSRATAAQAFAGA